LEIISKFFIFPLLLFFLNGSVVLHAEMFAFAFKSNVSIKLLSQDAPKILTFPASQSVAFSTDGALSGKLDHSLRAVAKGDLIQMETAGRLSDVKRLELRGRVVSVSYEDKKHQNQKRDYPEKLIVKSQSGNLVLINECSVNRYSASVVNSEYGFEIPDEAAKAFLWWCERGVWLVRLNTKRPTSAI
jgi:hypothetical protein